METNIQKYEEIIDRCFSILEKWRDEDDESLLLLDNGCRISFINEINSVAKTHEELRYIMGEAIATELQRSGFIVIYFCSDNALLSIEGSTPAFLKDKDYFEPDSEIINNVKVYWTED